MNCAARKSLILALGNDIFGDDAVGMHAARALGKRYGSAVDIVEAAVGGFALLDLLQGYTHALILDAVATGTVSPGTVMELAVEEFSLVSSTSPHQAGLPEVLAVAAQLDISLPHHLRIIAMEIDPPKVLSESLSTTVREALPSFVERAAAVLNGWG